jgi:hypothetical protein
MGQLVRGPSGRRTARASRRRGSARRRRRRELRISRRAGATDTAHDARNGHDEQPSDRRVLGPLVRPGDAVTTSAFVAPEQTRPSRNRPHQDLASPGVGGAPPALELTDAADEEQRCRGAVGDRSIPPAERKAAHWHDPPLARRRTTAGSRGLADACRTVASTRPSRPCVWSPLRSSVQRRLEQESTRAEQWPPTPLPAGAGASRGRWCASPTRPDRQGYKPRLRRRELSDLWGAAARKPLPAPCRAELGLRRTPTSPGRSRAVLTAEHGLFLAGPDAGAPRSRGRRVRSSR